MIFNKQAMKVFKAQQNKSRLQRLGVVVLVSLSFYFQGPAVAGLVGLCAVIYSLSEIDAGISYANFLKEHEIGLHDLTDD